MKRLYILILFFCLSPLLLHGQLIKQVSLAAVNENIAFPLTTYTPIHPGIEAGLTYRNSSRFEPFHQAGNVSGIPLCKRNSGNDPFFSQTRSKH